jgi:hypothetical protein
MEKVELKNESPTCGNTVLAVVLISLVWIAVLTIGVILAWIFDGGEFFIRTILIMPYSLGGVYASRSVWRHYR